MRSALVAWLLVVAMVAPRRALADDEEDKTAHVSAQFRTKRPVSQLRSEACALTGAFQIEGHARTWDVWFGAQRCSELPPDVDSIPLHVHVLEPEEEGGARTVTLDAMSDEIAEATLRRAVTSTGLALRDAHAITPSATEQVQTPQQAAPHGHGQGAAIAVAATAGSLAVVAVVVIVVVVVVGIVAGFTALFAALGKGI